MPSTRCSDAFRLSVPERAWLTSSRVDRRRASRVTVLGSAAVFTAGISGSYICEGSGRRFHNDVHRARRGTCAAGADGRLAASDPHEPDRTLKRFCSNRKFTRQNCVKIRSPRIPHFTESRWKCERDPQRRAPNDGPPLAMHHRIVIARLVPAASLLFVITLVTSAPIRADPVPRQPRLRLTD